MLRFGTRVAKEEFYGVNKPIKLWDVTVDNIVVSKSIEMETNSKYMIEYLDEVIRPLVLILLKMSEYFKTFKVEDGDKYKNNKLMPLCLDDHKLLQRYKKM